MKKVYQSLTLVVTLALPFVLHAQSSSSGSSASAADPSSTSTQPRVSTGATGSSDYRSKRSGMSDPSHSGMGHGQMMQVTKESLENKLTAKNLMDKDVYDRDHKKIGEVVDVVLRGQTGSLASAFGDDSDMHGMRDSTSTAHSDSVTDARGPVNSSVANSDRSSRSHGSASAMSGSMTGQNSVVIAHGGMLGVNRDLISVPMSQLSYDSSSKHFMLDVSSEEISNLTSTKTSAR